MTSIKPSSTSGNKTVRQSLEIREFFSEIEIEKMEKQEENIEWALQQIINNDQQQQQQSFPMYMFDGHVMMKIQNTNSNLPNSKSKEFFTCLIDTGSPSSSCYYGEEKPLELCGERFVLTKSSHGVPMSQIIELVGTHVDYLIGFSILIKFKTKIDSKNNQITFRKTSDPEELRKCDVKSSFVRIMQVPVVSVNLVGFDESKKKSVKFYFDTGAKVSYIHSKFLKDSNFFAQDANMGTIKKDFSPFVGNFETTVFQCRLTLVNSKEGDDNNNNNNNSNNNSNSNNELSIEFGSLPLILEASFLSNCDGVLGTSIFEYFSAFELDYDSNSLYFWK